MQRAGPDFSLRLALAAQSEKSLDLSGRARYSVSRLPRFPNSSPAVAKRRQTQPQEIARFAPGLSEPQDFTGENQRLGAGLARARSLRRYVEAAPGAVWAIFFRDKKSKIDLKMKHEKRKYASRTSRIFCAASFGKNCKGRVESPLGV